jgi:hypothetical protein
MTYEVQTYTLCAGWINLWTDDGNTLVTFETFEDAQKELNGFLKDQAHMVEIGHLEDFSPEDYKIVEVTS